MARLAMRVEIAKKDEPARNKDSCFSDRREVIAVEEASAGIEVFGLLLGSAILMREGLEANSIPNGANLMTDSQDIQIGELF